MCSAVVSCKIYVAGEAPNSRRAIANFTAFCLKYLPNRHSIAIIDVFDRPDEALADKVLLTPTLLIVGPPPLRTVIGDLSEVAILQQILSAEIDGPLDPHGAK